MRSPSIILMLLVSMLFVSCGNTRQLRKEKQLQQLETERQKNKTIVSVSELKQGKTLIDTPKSIDGLPAFIKMPGTETIKYFPVNHLRVDTFYKDNPEIIIAFNSEKELRIKAEASNIAFQQQLKNLNESQYKSFIIMLSFFSGTIVILFLISKILRQ